MWHRSTDGDRLLPPRTGCMVVGCRQRVAFKVDKYVAVILDVGAYGVDASPLRLDSSSKLFINKPGVVPSHVKIAFRKILALERQNPFSDCRTSGHVNHGQTCRRCVSDLRMSLSWPWLPLCNRSCWDKSAKPLRISACFSNMRLRNSRPALSNLSGKTRNPSNIPDRPVRRPYVKKTTSNFCP